MSKPKPGKWVNHWEQLPPPPDKKNPEAKRDGYTRSKEVLVMDINRNKFSAYYMHFDEGDGYTDEWEATTGSFIELGEVDHWMPLPIDPAPMSGSYDIKIAGQEVEIKYKENYFRPMIDGRPMTWVSYKEDIDFVEQLEKIVNRIKNRLERQAKKKSKKKVRSPNVRK